MHLYRATREVLAAERLVMLKTLRLPVRVVWVYRRTQWVALETTDLALTVAQIIEYYSARWKIEAGFRERRYHSENTTEFAFADVRRALSRSFAEEGFSINFGETDKPQRKPLIATILDLVA
jgi:hypothetical protein